MNSIVEKRKHEKESSDLENSFNEKLIIKSGNSSIKSERPIVTENLSSVFFYPIIQSVNPFKKSSSFNLKTATGNEKENFYRDIYTFQIIKN